MSMYKALTIAGSDTSGGAGIQADLKTFQERDVYGMTVLTTIVTMDPDNHWHHGVHPVALPTIEEQLKTVLGGIGVDALKTGMLGSVEIIELVSDTIKKKGLSRVVIDPVMVCKGNDEALHPESTVALRELLVPVADVVTPNLFEAAQLANTAPIRTLDDMKEAAQIIHAAGAKYVLIKGGAKLDHPRAVDLLFDGTTFDLYESDKIPTSYTHGAGCTYSAAITAELAKGSDVKQAVATAKSFIMNAIQHGFPLNGYVGPTMHSALRKFG
ncbi:pyridoxine/pyridoxal/pyridoxamine kinase [Paenibacillus sp. NPDC056579]|uniref:pyridoxine/pyridoxal/pyridoxamine kinase n=1 Tax=unclassified Paenibacillus TaxID=185978 RepID=UPI001EF9AF36|nr:pyridoxine/pyridoxal/pyridoxamine kinase [Paenibacillus sp. H1-7]ULL18174.1 bifunctional hydroxymethylpyrimidine kinase/phosphomethylpyrimidine kinase [Paenibacillus sp. H1-7]